jgi:3-deoxy-D-manno-octulosonic-acid transferase
MTLLYRLFLASYLAGIRISAAMGNPKAAMWLKGRKGTWEALQQLSQDEERIWFHCSSLGEFEQGRPVIEAYRQKNPQQKILLTFFSPSGYEVRKNYAGADYVFYLPMDSPSNSSRFITYVKPTAAFFVKYDFWHFYLEELKRMEVPSYVISSAFRPGQVYFKWYGTFFRNMLKKITRFYVQDKASAQLLKGIGMTNYLVTGDTRFDRVKQVAAGNEAMPLLAEFATGAELLVAGSTWPEDEKRIVELMTQRRGLKVIVAPHEVNETRMSEIMQIFPGAVKYSEATSGSVATARVIVIDSIGKLSTIYRYGRFAWIGGGFGKGIHNILEAAVYGQPVFFGPNYMKFREARELIELKGAVSITSAEQCLEKIREYDLQPEKYADAAAASSNYVSGRAGATEKILESVG